MNEKTFKPIDELIELLKTRGLTTEVNGDSSYAKNVLEKHGYYNMINGYNKLFLKRDSDGKIFLENSEIRYVENSSIQEINALYQFDRVLRNIFFRYILEVETNIKSLISYYFSEKHGHKNYLVYTNFNTSLKDSQAKITSLIADIQRQIASKSSDPSIAHYLKMHGYVPLWVLNNILTLGTISKFYSLMLPDEKQSISKRFSLMDNTFENYLQYISVIRNFCAHGNRIYCFRTKNPLADSKYHKSLEISKNEKGEYSSGKRDLFACVIALKSLLSKNDFKRMSKEIYRAIRNLEKKLSTLSAQTLLEEMGFPQKWRDLNNL